jgi:hypothetical protein
MGAFFVPRPSPTCHANVADKATGYFCQATDNRPLKDAGAGTAIFRLRA